MITTQFHEIAHTESGIITLNMEIKPPAHNLYPAITSSVSATSSNNLRSSTPPNWNIAQQIKAIITQITEKQLFLDIQGVKANTSNPAIPDLKIGDVLKLQIEQLKPMPQFRVIGLQKTTHSNVITQALRQISIQDTSITPMLKNMSFIANRPTLRPSPLAADVNAAVRNIFKQLPSPFNLKTSSQIKEHLQNSGTFIENKIKNQIFSALQNSPISKSAAIKSPASINLSSVLEIDLGAQLHRLANLIRTQLVPVSTTHTAALKQSTAPQENSSVTNKAVAQQAGRAPAEQPASLQNITQREEAMQTFLRQVESSLTHMQQTQLQNLNESQAGRPLWLMELPIKDGQDIDLFELRITEEENPQAENEAKKIWNITLKFDLTGLGKIKAHIKMQNDFVSAQFFSEKAEVLSLFRENFDFLRGRLNYNGLNVGNIECSHAKLSEEVPPAHSKPLDERT
jgi:flagellar hook-length control protein FliK